MKQLMLTGLLAIDPSALGEPVPEVVDRSNERIGDVAIVKIRGPLDRHASASLDSYDAIAARFDEACESDARTIVLRIHSPGGVVFGCFDGARDLRARADKSGKRLIAFVDGQACSAAYAYACAAHMIVAPMASVVGSIGVLDVRVDQSALDKAMGLRFEYVTSGALKSYGHAHVPVTDAEIAAKQEIVNSMAAVFFGLVADMRGKPAKHFQGLQAKVMHGPEAKAAGLVDRVQTFDELLASLASQGATMSKYAEARAALEEAAKGDDEEAKRAQRALAAMDEEKDESAESEDDEEKDESAASAATAATAAVSSGTVSASTAGGLAARVNELGAEVAQLKRSNESSERRTFLASRPDLSKDLLKVLDGKPLAEVKAIVNAIPKAKAPKHAASAATVGGTRGEGQGDAGGETAGTEFDAVDAAMGVRALASIGTKREGDTVILGAPVARKKGA